MTRIARSFLFVLPWSALVGLIMSTQFLIQPFIWRNFAIDEILSGWIEIARDRLVIALVITALLAIGSQANLPTPARAAIAGGAAVLMGAIVGETILREIDGDVDRQDVMSFMGRIVCWTLVGGAVAGMLYLWRAGIALAQQAEMIALDKARLHQLMAASELEALQRQIEPHFLFNTLATIQSLRETDPAHAMRLLEQLSKFIISSSTSDPRTLGEEVDLVCSYLDVCASRMGGRLTVLRAIPQEFEALHFPPLMLATLAENAVKHGLFPQGGGSIAIGARRIGDALEVSLTDDGVGFADQSSGTGIGLANVAERLRLLFGREGRLRLEPGREKGICATVRIPVSAA